MDVVGTDIISTIAEHVFGKGAEITCLRPIAANKAHGITETPPSTRNVLYHVELAGHDQPYVFRFSRVEDDVYEQEAANYSLLSDATGVRVPTIYHLDTSRSLVPTSYMVIDYLPGKLWNYVAHPENPETDESDKRAVGRLIGNFYSRAHAVTRDAREVRPEAQTLLYTMDRLERAVERGNVDASEEDIDRCRQAILNEEAFREEQLSLCLADSEIHVQKKGGDWGISFVCDAEWVEFRSPYADLTQMLAGPLPWWRLEKPAPYLDPEEVASRPFFRGYDPDRLINYRELLRLSAYFQLGLWAYVAMTSRSPDKKSWIREAKGPLIQELIGLVSGRLVPTKA